MKFIKNSFGLLVVLLTMFTACTDFVEPRIPYSEFDTGLYLRTTARTSTSFNFFDLANSRFTITIEAVDAELGATLENVEVTVRKRRLIPGVGLEFVPAAGAGGAVVDVLVTTLSRSDFAAVPDSRFPRATINITANEAMSRLGITAAQVDGGDIFEFRLSVRDNKGRTFNDVNASADVKGGLFYASPFLYNVGVVCPSDLGGTYRARSVGATGPLGSCSGPVELDITLTPVANTTSYTVSDGTFGYWSCIGDTWGNGNVRITDACGLLSMSGSDKYGDGYSMEFVSSTATELTFIWRNTYGESGTVTLFANEGRPWPAGLR
ncbi:hypothetical protein [Mongoliitalea daihaiensis]|uniref:hypothetical protein n=1 Tax=Mongoliitalea daihaiensis TaxID=2782006 RepID=UPI001F2DCAB3|nr:hypothetical protein [Mongoliitalea daihaiensis]UJP66499.1 hypothetical protein IPZ59_07845 [Mongoliitalea daihaiensis]